MIVKSPEEACEKSDAIITCVSSDDALKKVLFSENGVFESISKDKILIDCGKNTYAQRAKIALNLVLTLILESYIESIILGVKNGVPLNTMLEILENFAAKSGVILKPQTL